METILFFGCFLEVIGVLGLAGVFDSGIFSRIDREQRMRADIALLRTELVDLKSRIILMEGRMARVGYKTGVSVDQIPSY